MNLKQLYIFGMENSQEPVIKNPVLRAALEGPRTMAQGGRIIGKPGGLVEPGVKYYGVSLREGDLLNPYRVTLKTSEGQLEKHFATETEAYNFFDKKEAEALKKGTKKVPSPRYLENLANNSLNDYNKIIDYAVNNRKVKNFAEPVEIKIGNKTLKFTEIPTVNEFVNQVGNPYLKRDHFTKYTDGPTLNKENAFKKIVNDTIKLNNQTFRFSTVDDIAEDIGYKKGNPGGVVDLFEGSKITKPFNRDEIVSKYIQHLVDNDAPLKDFSNESIFRHVNSRRSDLIKKNIGGKSKWNPTIPGSNRTIDFNSIGKIMKSDHPELFAKIGRDGQIPFLGRSIQNKPNLGNLTLSEAFTVTDSGQLYFNEVQAKNIKLTKALSGITAETDILAGKLKLDQKSLAISNAQDEMVKTMNSYARKKPNIILENQQLRKLASTRFEKGKFIIDDDSAKITERLNRYIKRGFFSTDHKVSKRTGKLNIEFPTNKQIVATFINGPIRSMENYIADNISKYSDADGIIKSNIDNIVNFAKNNNFTVNVPEGHSKIFGPRLNVGAVADVATVSADGKVLTGYDTQLKRYGVNIDDVPELSKIKNVNYLSPTEFTGAKERLTKTLATKTGTAEKYTQMLGKDFKEVVNNSKRGGALLTHNTLSKGNFKPKCKTKFANGGGGLCGKAFAEADPQAYLDEVMKDLKATKYLQSKEGLTAAKSFLSKVPKVGYWAHPLTLGGGEAWYSALAGYNEWGKGASLAESVNEGLWFIPGKHSRSLNELLGSKTKGKAGRNLPVISDEVRSQFDLLTQLGGLINEEGKLSGQLFMQQLETGRLEDVKAKSLWEERFDPEKAFATEKSAEDIKLDYENMKGDIQWSKDIITPQIEERLKNVGVEGQDIFEKWQTADPEEQSYSALQDKIKDFIVNKYNKGRTWDQADRYSGPVWNWMKTSWSALPFTDPELAEKQLQLQKQKITGQLPDLSITKENIPPELIENFLTEFPEYSYIFEGAEGGIASLMKKKW
jgi:hypothetical protein